MRAMPFYVVALLLTATSTFFDVRRRRIPNWLTFTALPLAPLAWAWLRRGAPGAFFLPGPVLFALLSIVGGMACALVPLILFRFSMIGGGDVKLLACVGALTLPSAGLLIEWLSLVIAALLIPALLTYRGRLFATVRDTFDWVVSPLSATPSRRPVPPELRERICFSPCVFVATVATTLLQGAL